MKAVKDPTLFHAVQYLADSGDAGLLFFQCFPYQTATYKTIVIKNIRTLSYLKRFLGFTVQTVDM